MIMSGRAGVVEKGRCATVKQKLPQRGSAVVSPSKFQVMGMVQYIYIYT